MAKVKVQSFLGRMYFGVDLTNENQVSYYIQKYMDENGKPPDIIVVDPTVDTKAVRVSEKFLGLGVNVIAKQYCLKGHIHVAGYIYTTKEI